MKLDVLPYLYETLIEPNLSDIEKKELFNTLMSIYFNYFKLHWETKVWTNTKWRGYPIYKYTTDIMTYQDIIFSKKPDLIIETGTYYGGSALFMADMCELNKKGDVISVDNEHRADLPWSRRLIYLNGDCLSDDIISHLSSVAKNYKSVMVNLDSRHDKYHVDKELELYSKFVTPGQYLIVDDTYLGLWNDVQDKNGVMIAPGPREAVNDFLKTHKNFKVDRTVEKYILTQNPCGYLLRTE